MAAGAIGNVLEWYDFAIYGYFASVIGKTFFPHEDPLAQLLSAYGIFAIGFVVRPLGGVVVGHIGDRFGRATALTVSVSAMAIPTFLIGVLPGYQTLGLLAPVLLTVLRMVQGLSVGGESSTSIVFMVERAPESRRGVMGAVACVGATGGMMLGSASGALLAWLLPSAALESWGWRIPFLLGLAVGIAGYHLRRDLAEAPRAIPTRPPLVEAIRVHGFLMFRLFALSVLNAVGFFVVFVYIVTWLQRADGLSPARALGINTVSMLLYMAMIVFMAWLSDRVGRKLLMLAAAVICFVGAFPLFWLMHDPDPALILLGQFGFILALGMSWGVLPAIMVEASPPGARCTVIALAFNVTMGLVGGVTPLVATWMVARTHEDLSPAFLVMGAAAITFLATLSFGESYRSKLAVA
ncbi:MAG TPA: MFS transporter [Reyranella sp.]|nr:MFS transporter [Reyranella sp.]